ncbi:hypothetical protein ABKV19_010801 [Rosa sericea]
MSGRVRGDLERFLIQGKEEDDGLVVTHDRPDGETIVSGAGEDALVGHIGDAEVPPAPVQPYPQIVTLPDRRVSVVPYVSPWMKSLLRGFGSVDSFDVVQAAQGNPDIIDIAIGSLPPVVTLNECVDLMEIYDSEQLRNYYPYESSSGTFATDASLIRPQGGEFCWLSFYEAVWAASFLRNHLLSKDIVNVDKSINIDSGNVAKASLSKEPVGLAWGFLAKSLLTRADAADYSSTEKDSDKMSERNLLGVIVKALLHMISDITQVAPDILESLSAYFPPSRDDIDTNITAELSNENCDNSLEDIWGIAGLVLGLVSSVGAMYRAGAHDAIFKIKDVMVSWVPHMNRLVQGSGSYSGGSEIVLSVGSCLAIPILVAFCQRVELMDETEVNHLVNGYRELISELLSVKKSGTFYHSLLMASCIGAGSLLACILNEGVHAIEVERVKDLLELFKKCYSSPYPPLVHFGGMLGVVNAMGAGAGILLDRPPLTSVQAPFEQKESGYVMGPLLSNPACERHLTSLMQDIFLVAQKSDDHQLQQYAAWAASFLRNHLLSKDAANVDNSINTDPGNVTHVGTVITVVRCLSQAPRLPTLDWGSIIRRGMRYEAQVAEISSTLEWNLPSCILNHLADLIKVISGSRLDKPFSDLCNYFTSATSRQSYDTDEIRFLWISCWKGLNKCLDEASLDSLEYISHIEKCMEVLFSLQPAKQLAAVVGIDHLNSLEWSEAVTCLGKARKHWLVDFLQVSQEGLQQRDSQRVEVLKKKFNPNLS